MKIIPFVLVLAMISGCAAAPFVTEGAIDRQVLGLVLGQSKVSVIEDLGVPHHRISFKQETDTVEILIYEMGNYSYSKTQTLFFKNGRLIAVPKNETEMLRFMSLSKMIPPAQFWSLEQSSKAAAEKTKS